MYVGFFISLVCLRTRAVNFFHYFYLIFFPALVARSSPARGSRFADFIRRPSTLCFPPLRRPAFSSRREAELSLKRDARHHFVCS